MMRMVRRGYRGMGDDGEVTITQLPGGAIDSEGNIYGTPDLTSITGVGTQPGGGIDWAKIINSSVGGALNIFKSTQSPYVIPGTNVLYNPATGQSVPASGGVLGSSSVGNLSSLILPVGLGIGALILLSSLGHK